MTRVVTILLALHLSARVVVMDYSNIWIFSEK